MSSNYKEFDDAGDGPLKPGDVGTLIEDDNSSKPYRIEAKSGSDVGKKWWYKLPDLVGGCSAECSLSHKEKICIRCSVDWGKHSGT